MEQPQQSQTEQEVERTFLFTDIEGSTRLWEAHPIAMRRALAQHDALLFALAEKWQGHVFKTIGDAFCIAFRTPLEAVCAVVEAQRALMAQDWGQVGEIRVRMALHCGLAEARDNDYFGPPLNRAARLRDAGHGGQVLVSAAVHAALPRIDHVSEEIVTFEDLGEHELKDLGEPEHVFQICATGLPTEFPKLRTPSNHPNNLPANTTSFVGRRAEARAVREMLLRDDVRLITLTGMGGTGKTRLALDVASNVLGQFKGGVWFADLAALSDPSLVLPTLLRACGLEPDPDLPAREQLAAHFRAVPVLFVLDNFEQVADAAEEVAALLRATHHLKALVTSRIVLELSMEHEYSVPPLRGSDCAALFETRAQQAQADFVLNDTNRSEVEAICGRLDNMPLAVELAAAQIRSLTLDEITRGLDDRLALLSTRMRDLPARQRSLRGTIDWSYSLLNPAEQRLFRGLSLFAGGFTPYAAECVCRDALALSEPVEPLLEGLRDKSLVRIDAAAVTGKRYTLLESLRQYGVERLEQEEGEPNRTALTSAHIQCYLEIAEAQEPRLRSGEMDAAKAILVEEIANLRAAMDRALISGDVEAAARFGCALRRFWERQGYLREGQEQLERVLEQQERIERPELRADLFFVAGSLALCNSKAEKAIELFEKSVLACHAIGDAPREARALVGLGVMCFNKGDLSASDRYYEQALQIRRAINDRRGEATLLNNLALNAIVRGSYSEAKPLFEQCLALTWETGDESAAAIIWSGLGVCAEAEGDLAAAREALNNAVSISERHGMPQQKARALLNRGAVALRESKSEEAAQSFQEAVEILRSIDDRLGIAECLIGLSRVALSQGEILSARESCRESLEMFREAQDKKGITAVLESFAEVAVAFGRANAALLFISTARALRQETGARATPYETERAVRVEAQAAALMPPLLLPQAPSLALAIAEVQRLLKAPLPEREADSLMAGSLS